MSPPLWHIEGALQDAAAWLADAQYIIGQQFPENEPEADLLRIPFFAELSAMSIRLGQLEAEVRAIIGPELRAALKEEAAELDHLSDLADAASY